MIKEMEYNKSIRDIIDERYRKHIKVQSESKITPECMKPDIIKRHELIHKLIMIVCDEGMTVSEGKSILSAAASEIEAAVMNQKL